MLKTTQTHIAHQVIDSLRKLQGCYQSANNSKDGPVCTDCKASGAILSSEYVDFRCSSRVLGAGWGIGKLILFSDSQSKGRKSLLTSTELETALEHWPKGAIASEVLRRTSDSEFVKSRRRLHVKSVERY